jgi:hypothetical protein
LRLRAQLLQQKQPEFSAVLEFAVREVSIQLGAVPLFPASARRGGSQTLFCHPNTVRHRLNRVTEHTRRSLTDPRAVTELTLALQADYLGWAA